MMCDRVLRSWLSYSSVLVLGLITLGVPPWVVAAQPGAPLIVPKDAAAPKPMAYDVVSIKRNDSGTHMMSIDVSPDGFSYTNLDVKTLIANAYNVKNELISGAPSWVDGVRYDIQAKVAADDVAAYRKLGRVERRSMLQTVLIDRFKLKVHTEMKDLPIYELVVAKGGLKMHEGKADDTYEKGIKGLDGKAIAGPGAMMMRPGQFTGQQLPVSALLDMLGRSAGRTVVDKTGLTGKYDFDLQWTPDASSGQQMPPGMEGPPPATEGSGPSLFTALQEQLGLQLKSSHGPVETIVVDHVEQPSEN